MGNPVLEFATDLNSRAEFFWSHGLISDSTYKLFTSVCNYSRYVNEYYRGNVSPICSRVMSQVSKETSRFVDKYDVTLDVCISTVFSQSKYLSPQVSTSITCQLFHPLHFGFHFQIVLLYDQEQITHSDFLCPSKLPRQQMSVWKMKQLII